MREIHNIYILLCILYLFISFNISKESPSSQKNIIPDDSQNETYAFRIIEYLEENEPENTYLYLKLNFNILNQNILIKKNTAIFKLTTEFSLTNPYFEIFILDKNLKEVNSTDINNHNNWELKYFVDFCENIGNKYIYYFIVHNKHNEFGEKNKGKSLLLRISMEKKKGRFTIQNLDTYPEMVFRSVYKKDNKNLRAQNNPHWNPQKNYNNYYNHNYNQNYNYDYHKFYDMKDHRYYHIYYRKRYYNWILNYSMIFGCLLWQIWLVILVLYCLVSRKKNPTVAVVIGNIPQQNN